MEPQASKRLEFHKIVEKKVEEVGYGTVTVNVILKDGEPIMSTLNVVKARRWKFRAPENDK